MIKLFLTIVTALLLAGCPDTKLPKPPSNVPAPKAADLQVGGPKSLEPASEMARR